MALRETFANNTIKFEKVIEEQKRADAQRFLITIAIPAAERISRTTSNRKFCISVPSTIDFETVAEMLKEEPYGFETETYIEDNSIIIKW